MSSDDENVCRDHSFSRESLAKYNLSLDDGDSSSATLSLGYNEEIDPIFTIVYQFNLDLVK